MYNRAVTHKNLIAKWFITGRLTGGGGGAI